MGDSSPSADNAAKPRSWLVKGLLSGLLVAAVAGIWIGRSRAQRSQESEAKLASATPSRTDLALGAFVKQVSDDVQQMWAAEFELRGKVYEPAELVLFERRPALACPPASAVFGSAHCPGEHKAYVDLARYRELERLMGASADAVQVYVIAHELGHHVQALMGIDVKVKEALVKRPVHTYWSSVQVELQADCLAGVWARRTTQDKLLEKSEVERVLKQTSEDGLARQAGAENTEPYSESYTYAVPRRRLYWFAMGYQKGQIQDCDTFATD